MRVRPTLICIVAACALTPAAGAQARSVVHLPSSGAVQAARAIPATPPAALVRQAESAFRKTSAGSHDLSPLLRRLAMALPSLHGAERQRAASLLARPTDGEADPQQNGWSANEAGKSPLCSAHFCVHWVAGGSDAPNLTDGNGNGVPDWVETVSATAEHVYAEENGRLGWRAPKGDGSHGGGSNLVDIYLSDVGGSGIYGYAAPDRQSQSHSLFAYLVLDNDFDLSQFPGYASPVAPLDVTLAHEYNHVLQYAYDADEDTWMLESSAVWMEGKLYEPVHDYLQYLPGWAQLTLQPITSFDGNDPNNRTNVKVYGSSVWNKWLDQRFGQEIVRSAWEGSVAAGSFGPAAYDAAIRKHSGPGFSAEFSAFSAATAEWQAGNSGFPDGSLYPDVGRAGRLVIDGAPGTIQLDHTAFALVNVPLTAAPKIKLAAAAPSGTTAALALVGRAGSTQVTVLRNLPKGGRGTVTLDNPGNLDRLTGVLINADVHHGPYSNILTDWTYKRDGQVFYGDVSTDFSAPSASVSGSQTLTAKFSERMLFVSRSSFSLVDSRGHRVSARLKFKPGTTTATLTPRSHLKSGRRYRVRLSSAISDLAFNRLGPVSRSFTAR